MAVSVGAVKARLRRARQKLRDLLTDRKIRATIRKERRGRRFKKGVMAGLGMLLADQSQAQYRETASRPVQPAGPRLGHLFAGGALVAGGVAIGIAAMMLTDGQAPGGSGALNARPHRVRLMPPDAYMEFIDATRFPEVLEPTASLFGTPPLSERERRLQEAALESGGSGRVVWEFGDSPAGWSAHQIDYSGLGRTPLPVRVVDGALEISLDGFRTGRLAEIQLVSPELGYEAGLFDRVRLRVRVDHTEPTTGAIGLSWTTPANRLFPGRDPRTYRRSFLAGQQLPERGFSLSCGKGWRFSREWQDLECEGLTSQARPSWRGPLVDVRISIHPVVVDTLSPGNRASAVPPQALPSSLFVDRVELIGSAGPAVDLPVGVAEDEGTPGQLFTPGSVTHLRQRGATDVLVGMADDDGHSDAIVMWRAYGRQGWTVLKGNGHGGFDEAATHELTGNLQSFHAWCAGGGCDG